MLSHFSLHHFNFSKVEINEEEIISIVMIIPWELMSCATIAKKPCVFFDIGRCGHARFVVDDQMAVFRKLKVPLNHLCVLEEAISLSSKTVLGEAASRSSVADSQRPVRVLEIAGFCLKSIADSCHGSKGQGGRKQSHDSILY